MEEEANESNHAADVGISMTWIFRLSKQDALLVLKALRGTLKPAEQKPAKELCDRLTELRYKIGKDVCGGLEKAYENMLKENQPPQGNQ